MLWNDAAPFLWPRSSLLELFPARAGPKPAVGVLPVKKIAPAIDSEVSV